ncbi:MAG: sulfatase, partial [Chloroflexota bacterium]
MSHRLFHGLARSPLALLVLLIAFALAACDAAASAPTTVITTVATPTKAAVAATAAPAGGATSAPVSTARPNILFILTDDMAYSDLAFMPKLKSLIIEQGTAFSNYFLNVPLCCPSRTTTLRGQYNHNTTIFGNKPPDGGFDKFFRLGEEKSTISTWLHDAGYRTALIGKYLNGYPGKGSATYVPPGWDEFDSPSKGNPYSEFNYTLNENGKLVAYGNKPDDYGTDVYGRKAVDFMQRSAKDGKPFFLYLATYAPHGPATPAPRHANLFADVKLPHPPNFNEADVSDKSAYIRNRPLLNQKEINALEQLYRKRIQSLQAVDEMIGNLVDTLTANGQLDNTYIFFSSDNGFHLGQHRLLQGKQTAFEEDIRVPLIVRGPGVTAGRTLDQLVGNVDYAPTWAELAGAKTDTFVDGRSLVPLMRGNTTAWRTAYLIQHGNPDTAKQRQGRVVPAATTTPTDDMQEPPDNIEEERGRGLPELYALRTKEYTYIEYVTGEKELYDLKADPYELQNIINMAKPDLIKVLAAQLAAFHQCVSVTCRT